MLLVVLLNHQKKNNSQLFEDEMSKLLEARLAIIYENTKREDNEVHLTHKICDIKETRETRINAQL